ncbi:MAG: type I restriction enzyme endonuclease domain-containing protein [Acidithiobacillus sp.]
MVKLVLQKHGCPPDMQEGAVNMVIEQAEWLVERLSMPKQYRRTRQ